MCWSSCLWSASAPADAVRQPETGTARGARLLAKGGELLIQRLQLGCIAEVLSAIEQPGDAFGVERKGGHLLPEAFAAFRSSGCALGLRQLPHQQKHQLLFLAQQGTGDKGPDQ